MIFVLLLSLLSLKLKWIQFWMYVQRVMVKSGAVGFVPSLSAGIRPTFCHCCPIQIFLVLHWHVFFHCTVLYFSSPLSHLSSFCLLYGFLSLTACLPSSYIAPFPLLYDKFLFSLISLFSSVISLVLLTELFQRCLEHFWLCDCSGQHHWHSRYGAWGK